MSSRLCSRNALTVCCLASLFHCSTSFIFCCASPLLLVLTYYPLPSPVTITNRFKPTHTHTHTYLYPQPVGYMLQVFPFFFQVCILHTCRHHTVGTICKTILLLYMVPAIFKLILLIPLNIIKCHDSQN